MTTVLAKEILVVVSEDEKKTPSNSVSSLKTIPLLGTPGDEKRFFFQRGKTYNADAVATQVELSGSSLEALRWNADPFKSRVCSTIPTPQTNTTQSKNGGCDPNPWPCTLVSTPMKSLQSPPMHG